MPSRKDPAPSRSDIVSAARRYIGTPYMHLQRNSRFLDCVGLVIAVAREFDLGDYRKEDYGRIPDPVHMRQNLESRLDRISPMDIKPGHIIWFAFAGVPRHVGIAGDYPDGQLSVIHAYYERRKVVEHSLDRKWQRRICGAFSFRGLAD